MQTKTFQDLIDRVENNDSQLQDYIVAITENIDFLLVEQTYLFNNDQSNIKKRNLIVRLLSHLVMIRQDLQKIEHEQLTA